MVDVECGCSMQLAAERDGLHSGRHLKKGTEETQRKENTESSHERHLEDFPTTGADRMAMVAEELNKK